MSLATNPHYTIGITKYDGIKDAYLHRVANTDEKTFTYSFKTFENKNTTQYPERPVVFQHKENALEMLNALQGDDADTFSAEVRENLFFLEPVESWERINPEWFLDPK